MDANARSETYLGWLGMLGDSTHLLIHLSLRAL